MTRTSTAPAQPRDEQKVDELLEELAGCAVKISNADAELRQLWADRVAMYRRGVELGVSKADMGRAAGTSPEAVIHALKRGG